MRRGIERVVVLNSFLDEMYEGEADMTIEDIVWSILAEFEIPD